MVTLSGAVTEMATVSVLAGVNTHVLGSTGWLLEMSPDGGLPLLWVYINLPGTGPTVGPFGALDCLGTDLQLDVGVIGVAVTPQWSLSFDINNAIPPGATFQLSVSSIGAPSIGDVAEGWGEIWPSLHGTLTATLLPVSTNTAQQSGDVGVSITF